jgi:hypothetical protein
MWYRSYRDHAIMPFPSFDTATHSWAPQANISWVAGPARDSAFVRFPMRVTSEGEAVASALAAAKTWIDERQCAPIGSLLRTSARQTRRIPPPASSRNSGKTLTFDDFKANLANLTANASERSLFKSHGAFIKLRKTSHCSWAQIKSKLKRSQENPVSPQPANPREKSARLPLTPRDWRRII